MNYENKKSFDPTVSFMFFGTWVKAIESVKETLGIEAAYKLFEAIINYSMYDEQPSFADIPILRAIWITIEKEIDISINNRRRGFAKDEMDEKRQAIIDAIIKHPSGSCREIADMVGAGKSAVDRVKHKYKAIIDEAIANGYISGDNNDSDTAIVADTDTYTVNVNDNDIDNDIDNDSMGRDRDGTAGQQDLSKENNIIDCFTDEEKRELTVLDRMRERLIDEKFIELEILANDKSNLGHVLSVRGKWHCFYREWQKSITNEAVESILDMYLSTNTETEELKRIGDKYGRIIDGWNEEKQEPNIVYSVTGYFPVGIRHNITDIPIDYYAMTDERMYIEEEREMINSWIDDDDMPF